MKKIFLLATLFVAANFASCDKNEATPDVFPENGLVTITRTIGVATRSGGEATLTAVFDINKESLVGYSVSPELLEAVQMTAGELDQYLKEEMGAMYYLQSGAATRGSHSDCIRFCLDNYERGDGRGSCKFACWIDTAIVVLETIADFFD